MTDIIKGAGGGGGHTPTVAPTTLRTKTTAKVMFLTSAGEVGGLVDQVNPLKSVIFDSTPVMNADGSLNFTGVSIAERTGTDTQSYVPDFPSASTTYAIGTKVTTAAPVVHDTIVSGIDSVRVTIRFPALFKQESNGDEVGNSVHFRIESRLGTSGTWGVVHDVTQTDKSPAAADLDWLVRAPGAGRWQVRVVRVTADNTSLSEASDIYFQTATNIIDTRLAYRGAAYIAVKASADTTGADFPRIAFDTYGIKVKTPSNYTVSTRTYSGVWDGLMKAGREVCDNPTWLLYEALTNSVWGMGIPESDIDKYSFYSAAQYNDQLVPNGKGGQEPRYTFNYQFMNEEQGWDFIQNIAASFGAIVYTSGNRVLLVQDRPTTRSRLITNSNVMDGIFNYMSSSGRSRYTAAISYYNDPNQGWLSIPTYYEDSAAVARYGYNKTEVAQLGATSEGQAYRYAKWFVETSVSNTDVVNFKVGLSEAGFQPGEVIDVFDTDYAQVMGEAKLVSKTSSSITLDRPLTVAAGNTFDLVGDDGHTIITRTITSTGTLSTISFSGADFTSFTGSTVILTGAVAPRKFKVTTVREEGDFEWAISAVQYDESKFGRVDGTFTLPAQVYQAPVNLTVTPPVTGITFVEESYTTAEGQVRRYLRAHWSPAANSFITSYAVFWKKDDGQVNDMGTINQPYIRFPADTDGTYSVNVVAVNADGVRSTPATGQAVVNISTPVGAASLSPVTSLFIKGTTGGSFSSLDAAVSWVDTQANGNSVIAGYEVQVKTSDGATTLRTELVQVNEAKQYVYTYAKNIADGGPRRSFIISVRVKDTFGRFSSAAALACSNATPAAPALTVSAGYGMFFVKVGEAGAAETDIEGCNIYVSTTPGFTPGAGNLVSSGADRVYSQSATAGTTYYARASFYDSFSRTGLNLSSEYSVVPVTFSPPDPNEYKFSGISFKANDPVTNSVSWTAGTAVKTSGTSAGSSWTVSSGSASWTSGTLYLYYVEGSGVISSTTSLATAVGANHVIMATYKGGLSLSQGDGDFFIDGSNIYAQTIGATQLVTGSAVITGTAQLADAIITTAKVDSISAAKLDAGTVSADKMEANLFQSNNVLTRGLTVRDGSGNVILSAGTPLTATYADAALKNSSISIAANGTLSGAGGGQVTVAGLDNTIVRSANPITSTNISTYIAAAAIDYARIGSVDAATISVGKLQTDQLDAHVITTEKLVVGSVNSSSISGINSVSIYSGAATSTVSGYLQGPTLTVTGGNVLVGCTGRFTITPYSGTTPAGNYSRMFTVGAYLKLYNVTTGAYVQVMTGVPGVGVWSVDSIYSFVNTTFGKSVNVTGMVPSLPAGTYRLDLYAANVDSYYLTAGGGWSADNAITGVFAACQFFMNEVKV